MTKQGRPNQNLSLPFLDAIPDRPLRRRSSKAPVDVTGLETILLNQARAEELLKLVDEAKPYFKADSTSRQMARAYLDGLLEKGKTQRFVVEAMDVTPALALEMLHHNKQNRPLIVPRIQTMITTMRDGNWLLTHQGASFTKDGILCDGQKRLWACAISGIDIKMPVTFGVEQAEADAIDLGQAQTLGDTEYRHGKKHHNLRAAAITLLHSKNGVEMTRPDIISLGDMMDQDILDAACEYGSKIRNVMNRTACAAAYYKMATKTAAPRRLAMFMEYLNTGAIPEKNSPILKFRETIRGRNKTAGGNSRSAVFQEAAMMIVAWNAWVKGKKVRSIVWESNSEWPEVD